MGWVDPWVGLGRVGSRFSVFSWLGWVHYSKSTKNLKGLCERIESTVRQDLVAPSSEI